MAYFVGVDVGGSFVDLVLLDTRHGQLHVFKSAVSTEGAAATLDRALRELLAEAGARPEDVGYFVHGTTVATNVVVERAGAHTGLITTRGFRDILELARQKRPHLYDLDRPKPEPLVPRDRRVELAERTYADGSREVDFDEGSVGDVLEYLRGTGVESVAICFLHSYLDPTNERMAGDLVSRLAPDLPVSISCEISPEFREYERTSTVVLNAYVAPKVQSYTERLDRQLRGGRIAASPKIFKSNGGLATLGEIVRRPIDLLNSGPAAGVVGAVFVARNAGFPDVITLDMGGTSSDLALVTGSAPREVMEQTVDGFPVRNPSIDVQSTGSGGGSIIAVDQGGFVTVGPRSAAAVPGPACYGRGGFEATLTDANVVLGRLNPRALLAGRMPIDAALAERAMAEVGARLGVSAGEAAAAALKILSSNLFAQIRLRSVGWGFDPRRFTLVAFGGAGPLHAAQIARESQIPRVLVPRYPGVLSAIGLLAADFRADVSRTLLCRVAPESEPTMSAAFDRLEAELREWCARELPPTEQVVFARRADLRYRGQSHELTVSLPDGLVPESICQTFHQAYRSTYGRAAETVAVELVTARVSAIALGFDRVRALARSMGGGSSAKAPGAREKRQIYDEAAGNHVATSVYRRDSLGRGLRLEGPCLVEQLDSTCFVPSDFALVVDDAGNLLLEQL